MREVFICEVREPVLLLTGIFFAESGSGSYWILSDMPGEKSNNNKKKFPILGTHTLTSFMAFKLVTVMYNFLQGMW